MISLTASLGNLEAAIYSQHEAIGRLMAALVWIALVTCAVYAIWYLADWLCDLVDRYRANQQAEREWPERHTPLMFNKANYYASRQHESRRTDGDVPVGAVPIAPVSTSVAGSEPADSHTIYAFRFPTDQGVA